MNSGITPRFNHRSVGLNVLNLLACSLALGLFYHVLFVIPPRELRAAAEAAAAREAEKREELSDLYEESREKLSDKQYAEAAVLTEKLLQTDPDSHIYIKQLAKAYHELGEYRREADALERFLLVAPRPQEGCPAIGQAYQRAKQKEKAVRAFERCYEISPSSDNIFFLAHAYEREGRYAEAEKLYKAGLAESPGYDDIALGLGRVQLTQGRPAEAAKLAKDVLAESPEYTDALLLLGMSLYRLRDLDGAKVALKKGMTLSPNYVDFHYQLGRIAEDQGNREEALRLYQEGIKLSPDRRDLRKRLKALQGGSTS